MTKYQVSFDRRDRLSIEVEAYNEDDAIDKAARLLYDPRQWDIDEISTDFHDVEESDPAADRGDWEFHQAHDQ